MRAAFGVSMSTPSGAQDGRSTPPASSRRVASVSRAGRSGPGGPVTARALLLLVPGLLVPDLELRDLTSRPAGVGGDVHPPVPLGRGRERDGDRVVARGRERVHGR